MEKSLEIQIFVNKNGHRQLKSLYEMCPETKDMIDDDFRDYFKDKYGVELPPFD